MKVLSAILLLVSAALNLKHGWDAFKSSSPEQAKMMADLGISAAMTPYLGLFSAALALMLFFPRTFVAGNILNAFTIVLIMALSLHAGNIRIALIEIPFLVLPLLLIWLKYPF